ncbi:MAG TPA: hypothetical protein VGL83_21460 [Stellaceae bacterium]|jgi:hypothetical protein
MAFMNRKWGRLFFAAAALGAASLLAGGAQAANNNNVSIPLSGTVPVTCTVANNSSGTTTTFSDMTQGASNVLIGTITETCNGRSGYKVTLTEQNFSANQPSFKGSSSGSVIPYTLSYNGSTVNFPNSTATLTNSGSQTGTNGVAKALNLSFSAGAYTADSYSDTITITMASN